jgi:hypothetical protein
VIIVAQNGLQLRQIASSLQDHAFAENPLENNRFRRITTHK